MTAFSARDFENLQPGPARPAPAPARPKLAALAEALAGETPTPAYSPIVLAGLVRLVEFVLITASGAALEIVMVGASGHELAYVVAIASMGVLAVALFQVVGVNRVAAFRAPAPSGLRIMSAWALMFLAAIAAVFFLKMGEVFSRAWLIAWFGAGLAALIVERIGVALLTRHLTRTGRLDRRTVIVGGGEAGEALLRDLSRQTNTDLRIFGVFDDRADDRTPDVVGGFPKLGDVDDLVDFARHTRIDLVIFTLPITAETRLLQMLRKLWVLPIDIRLAAHANKLRLRPRSYSYIGSVPVLDVFDKPIADWDVVMKSAFDRIVGVLCLALLAPVLLMIALAVKLDTKGPVFFKQKRHGFNNECIEVWKFRSMFVDQLDFAALKQVTQGDLRVTRVGRFIRKTSLDELPQLFNVVWRGDLSLVGPRPHAIAAMAAERQYDEVVDGYFARHRVKPGITGWAQINGWRGVTDTPEKIQRRVEHDLYYIENWSILFDIYILLMTPFALIKAENAY